MASDGSFVKVFTTEECLREVDRLVEYCGCDYQLMVSRIWEAGVQEWKSRCLVSPSQCLVVLYPPVADLGRTRGLR